MKESEQQNETISEDDLYLDEIVPKEKEVEVELPETTIPDKFKDKSIEDVVKSYENLEKELSRKNNEVGELRSLTDEFLKLELNKKTSETNSANFEKEITDEELFNDPSKVVNDLISRNPEIKKLSDMMIKNERQVGMDKFSKSHPDWQDVVNSGDFNKWINESESRLALFKRADTEYDYALGSDIITMYKQANQGNTEQNQENTNQRNKALKSASVETSTSGNQRAKVYSRSALMNMRLKDPSRYEAMRDVVELAYIEGRVR